MTKIELKAMQSNTVEDRCVVRQVVHSHSLSITVTTLFKKNEEKWKNEEWEKWEAETMATKYDKRENGKNEEWEKREKTKEGKKLDFFSFNFNYKK